MASCIVQRPLVIQAENLDVSRKSKKAGFDGSVKNSKTATKKGGDTLGSRKALNDITNRTSVLQEASSQKKSTKRQGINVAEERFLHDHRKCSEGKQAASITFLLDMVLPGHDSISTDEHPKVKQVKTDPHSPRCYQEPQELSMPEFSDWFDPPTRRDSPQCSPICWDSPPCFPFAWQLDPVEYMLKQESDVRM